MRHRLAKALVPGSLVLGALLGTSPAHAAGPVPTTLGLTAAPPSPQSFGRLVELDVPITPTDAVGTVRLYDGATLLDTGVNYHQLWSYSSSDLAVGTHRFTVAFTPQDPTRNGSATASLTYVVAAAPLTATSTLLLATPASASPGQEVTLSAGITPGGTGTVTFFDGGHRLGSAPVVSGLARLATTTLSPGRHSVQASYAPLAGNGLAPSTSSTVVVTVGALVPPPAVVTPSAAAVAVLAAVPPAAAAVSGPAQAVGGPATGGTRRGAALPFTGADVVALLRAAAVLVVLGSLLTVLGDRRRATSG